MIKIKNFFIELIVTIFTISFGIFLVVHPEISSNGVKEGISLCCNILVPSLFPFIFLSSFMINSGISSRIGRFISPFSKIFNLPEPSLSVILLSMIGGFPVGAKGISDLFDRKIINKEQAERMLSFCVNAGPAFVLGVIGNSLIKDMKVAQIILISQIFSSIIVALFVSINKRDKTNVHYKIYCKYNLSINSQKISKPTHIIKSSKKIPFSESLLYSCESSSFSIINMCILVIIFNIFYHFLDYLQILSICSKMLLVFGFSKGVSESFPQIIIEVTKACESIYLSGAFPSLFSFAISWGGLCVHLQVISIMKKIKVNYLKFLAFRLLNAVLSSSLTFLIIKMKNINLNVRKIDLPQYSANFWGSVSLVLCCLAFLIDINFKKIGGDIFDNDK